MKQALKQAASLAVGFAFCAFGTYLTIRANIGLAPWDALNMGAAITANRPFGTMSIVVGVCILVLDLLLKEPIGIGTLLNTVVIGKIVDLYLWLDLVPQMETLASGIPVLLLGQFFLCFGIFLYMRTGYGSGPRDSLMVAFNKRLPKVPVGIARGSVDLLALLCGGLLGAKVGLGSVIAVCGISFIMQFTFRMVHFDPKTVHHENMMETFRRLQKAREASQTI